MNEQYKNLQDKFYRFLIWSEKYTRTDMRYLIHGSFWLAFGQGIQAVSGIALAVAFANLLPPETYGTYKYVISMAGIIGVFTLSGMGAAVTQAVAQGYEGILRQGSKEVFKWSIGIVGVALSAATYYYMQNNITLAIAMIFIAASYPVLKSTELYQHFLDGKKYFKIRSVYLAIWEIAQALILITSLFLTDNILLILFIFFSVNALIPLFFYRQTLRKFNPSTKVSSESSSYSKHLSVVGMISTIARHIDKVLIFHFLGPIEVAVYTFALLPIERLKGPSLFISKLALPKFSHTPMEVLKKTLPRKLFLFFILCVLLTLIVILLIPPVFNLIFPAYVESIPFAQALALLILFFPEGILFQSFLAHVQTKKIYKITFISSLIYIISLLVLTPEFGVWGVITAMFIHVFARSVLETAYFLN